MSLEDVERFNQYSHPDKWTYDDCVLWDGEFWSEYGGSKRQRHGMFLWGSQEDPIMMPAHRLAYTLYRGEFAGLLALHKCPGRTNKHLGRCVNPLHISPGDGFENMQDKQRDKDPNAIILTAGNIRACYESRFISVKRRAQIYHKSEKQIERIDEGRNYRNITRAPRPIPTEMIVQCFEERRALTCSERAEKYNVSAKWVRAVDIRKIHRRITGPLLKIVNVDW